MKKYFLVISLAAILAVAGIFLGPGRMDSPQLKGDKFPQSHDLQFPQSFAGMQRVQFYSGPQAIEDISKLHGKAIDIEAGFVATYQGPQRVMRLWISQSPSSAEARELFRVMDDKIRFSQVFSGRKKIPVDDLDIVYVSGMDMDNYYYVIDNRVYWVAMTGENSLQVLREVLRSF